MSRFLFPRWTNQILPFLIVTAAIAPLYGAFVVAYGFSPKTIDVGYQPVQPVPYSHAVHVGKLGLDCRYCHSTVDRAAFAAIPPTQTCLNCHTQIHRESPLLEPIRASYESGLPVEWIKVHKLPDYSYFNHSAHVNRGVGCVECHGRVDQMAVVYRFSPMAMGWCLECHRAPVDRLRPVAQMTNMSWDQKVEMTPAERESLIKLYHINPSANCSTCHR